VPDGGDPDEIDPEADPVERGAVEAEPVRDLGAPQRSVVEQPPDARRDRSHLGLVPVATRGAQPPGPALIADRGGPRTVVGPRDHVDRDPQHRALDHGLALEGTRERRPLEAVEP
jgi:hypothetical protein